MPSLIITKGTDEGKRVDLTQEVVTIGRDASNRIRLHDTEVSRRHAELHRSPEGYRVVDVGSANGTFVNSRSIRDVLLRPGDQLQVGQTVLVYSLTTGAEEPRRRDRPEAGDLADRIRLITRQDIQLPSAIVKSMSDTEGAKLLRSPEEVEAPWLRARLGVVYEAIQAASQILDLDQLLNRLMDLIFRTLDADRGCIMLRRFSDQPIWAGGTQSPGLPGAEEVLTSDCLEPRVVRTQRRADAGEEDRLSISRTIMDYVLRENQGILLSDASQDERFSSARSIVRSGVREVICAPMRGRHETLGVLYLDSLTRLGELPAGRGSSKFSTDHLALAVALAHQAALAVEDTRYYQGMLQAERLAAVGQTIAALSHHIKNILQGLRTGSEVLKMGLGEMDQALLQRGWAIVEKNQGKIYDLVMDMLSYSKERDPVIEDTNLNEVAEDVVELLAARAAEKGIGLELSLDLSLPHAAADREAIHRALLNIVGNALDAVEDSDSPRVLVACRRDAQEDFLLLAVEDNGPGISADKLDEIFRPFVSTKGSRGTGLGLAVSRKILREHGGDIIVRSQLDKGSRFLLRLPLRGPHAPDSAVTRELPVVPPRPESGPPSDTSSAD